MTHWEKRKHIKQGREISWHVGEKEESTHEREREYFCRGRDQKFARAQKTRRRKSFSTFFKRGPYCTAGRTVKYRPYNSKYLRICTLARFPRVCTCWFWPYSAQKSRWAALARVSRSLLKKEGRTTAFIAGI